MLTTYLIAFIIPLAAVLLLTPAAIRVAPALGAIDLPNERKIHQHPTPRLGGLSVFAGFLAGLLLLLRSTSVGADSSPFVSVQGLSFLCALLVVFLIGVADDIRSLNPGTKFLAQLVAASIVYAGGFRISGMTSVFDHGRLALGDLSYPVTVLWIVGVTNAFNLIDGLDGLASGVGLIATLSMASISYYSGDLTMTLAALALAGAIAGFLRYNFHPARIFLGDSGSLVIGFSLAVLSVYASTKGATAFTIAVPILALGVPIMDTLLAMLRRLIASFLPQTTREKRSIFSRLHGMFLPDRRHIHHQLISLGFSHRNVVLLLYLVSAVLGAGALAVTALNNVLASVVLLTAALALIAGIRQLRYKEMAILSNGLFLPLYEWPVTRQRTFQGFLDLAFSAVAFLAAFFLSNTDGTLPRLPDMMPLVAAIAGTQLAIFFLSGLYRSSFRCSGASEVLTMLQSVILAVAAGGAIALESSASAGHSAVILLFTDFYLLASFVVGSRVSFQILNFLFRRTNSHGSRVVIYGARDNGILTLQYLLQSANLNLQPVGFLDDDPLLEGKRVLGYPVFGGHWKMSSLLRKYAIHIIIVASDTMNPDVLQRVRSFADEHGLLVWQRKIFFEPLPALVYRERKLRPVIVGSPETSESLSKSR